MPENATSEPAPVHVDELPLSEVVAMDRVKVPPAPRDSFGYLRVGRGSGGPRVGFWGDRLVVRGER